MPRKIQFFKKILPLFAIPAAFFTVHFYFKDRPKQIAEKDLVDPLTRTYEYWSIELANTFRNKYCEGQFAGKYVLHVLFKGSLSQMLASPPTRAGSEMVGEGVYQGQEEVISPSSTKRSRAYPGPIAATDAKLTIRWFTNAEGSQLKLSLDSTSPLINSLCLKGTRIFPHPIQKIFLNGTVAEAQAIRGVWGIQKGQGDGSISLNSSDFKMSWLAGGASGRPIPGPPNLNYAIRLDRSVLVQWTPMPLAKAYTVYYSPGLTLDQKNLSFTRVETSFAAIPLEKELPYTFAVSAHVDGLETVVSSRITAISSN